MRWNICCLVGVLVLVPACGSSSGGGGGGGGQAAATIAITEDNALAVAGLVIGGSVTSAEVFEQLNEVLEEIDIEESGTTPCPGGGTVTVTSNIQSSDGPTAGDSGTITFNKCVLSVGGDEELDGSMSFVIGEVSTSAISIEFQIDELTVTDATDSVSINGDMSIEFSGNQNEARIVLRIDVLAVESDGETRSLENYVNDQMLNEDGFSTETSGTVRDTELDGTVHFETTEPLMGSGSGSLSSGQLLVTGADGSAVRITILNQDDIRVEVDADGDGEFEKSFTTTFDALDV